MGQSIFIIGGDPDVPEDYKFIRAAVTTPLTTPVGQWYGPNLPFHPMVRSKGQVGAIGYALKLAALFKQKDVIQVAINTRWDILDGVVVGGHTLAFRMPETFTDEMRNFASPGYSDDQPGVNRFYTDIDRDRNLPQAFNGFPWFTLYTFFFPEGFNQNGRDESFTVNSHTGSTEFLKAYANLCLAYFNAEETISFGWDIPGTDAQTDITDRIAGDIEGGQGLRLTFTLSDRQHSKTNNELGGRFNGRFN